MHIPNIANAMISSLRKHYLLSIISILLSGLIVAKFLYVSGVKKFVRVEVFTPRTLNLNASLSVHTNPYIEDQYKQIEKLGDASVYGGTGTVYKRDVVNFSKREMPNSEILVAVNHKGINIELQATGDDEIKEFQKMLNLIEDYWKKGLTAAKDPISFQIAELERLSSNKKLIIKSEEERILELEKKINSTLNSLDRGSIKTQFYSLMKANNFYFNMIDKRRSAIEAAEMELMHYSVKKKHLEKIIDFFPAPKFHKMKVSPVSFVSSKIKLIAYFFLIFVINFLLLFKVVNLFKITNEESILN